MDFKKLRKSSSKKLIKGGLGFFLSPREEIKNDEGITGGKDLHLTGRRGNSWETDALNIEPIVLVIVIDSSSSSSDPDIQNKDYIDDIPVIPSLDDFIDDDLTNKVAKAPLVGVKQVASYKDLENDLLKHSAFANLEEVNLQILIKLLHPESCLDEPDIPWTKEGLFNEIVTTINERNI